MISALPPGAWWVNSFRGLIAFASACSSKTPASFPARVRRWCAKRRFTHFNDRCECASAETRDLLDGELLAVSVSAPLGNMQMTPQRIFYPFGPRHMTKPSRDRRVTCFPVG